ncbi:MAG: sulfur carrier protein ThiS [Planctomycetes bacterium]|nr:sulfur carrier protein ThiS [Planctomycetota bacterium]
MCPGNEASTGDLTVTVNGVAHPAAAGASLRDLVEALGFAGRPIAVEVDGDVIPRAALADRTLTGGERIEIVTFVGGG